MRRALIIITTLLSCTINADSQRFHLGVSAAVTASQMDGDALSGFNRVGYQVAVVGGYPISEAHWIVLELQNGSFGSNKRNEDVKMNLEGDFNSVNVYLAYSLRFGDSWDGVRKFRFMAGPKFNSILEASGPNISKDIVVNSFWAGQITFSYIPIESLMIDLTYTHSFQNILSEDLLEADSLLPYYLGLGVTFYIFK